jgi:Integrase zinc binding domain/RNase H-like domain found in reverse transcriptase
MVIKHFRFLLEGRQFHVITDHNPLTAALHRVSSPISARQQRHLAFIAEFTGDICHVPGSANVVADTLSRPEAVHQVQQLQSSPFSLPGKVDQCTGLEISYLQLAQQQASCAETQQLLLSSSLKLSSLPIGESLLWGDVSTGAFRPLVPVQWQKKIFLAMHSISHPGRLATKRLISSRFVWLKISKDVQQWVAECMACTEEQEQLTNITCSC